MWVRRIPTTTLTNDATNNATGDVDAAEWAPPRRSVAAAIVYACLWEKCTLGFLSADQLEAHLDNWHIAAVAASPARCSKSHDDAVASSSCCRVLGCGIGVSGVDELARHMKMHMFHAQKQYNGYAVILSRYPDLTACNFPISTRIVYQGDALICEWNRCARSFTDINLYFAHLNTDHIERARPSEDGSNHITCLWGGSSNGAECRQLVPGRRALQLHLNHHSGDKACACPFCGAFFANNTKLLDHVVRRQERAVITTDAAAAANSHIKSETKATAADCEPHASTSHTEGATIPSEAEEDEAESKEFSCHLCQKRFPTARLLRDHCKRHVKRHKCSYCALVLESDFDLRRHVAIVHAKIRNHHCTVCNKGFFHESDLTRHMSVHTSLTAHKCPTCAKSYRWEKQLKYHQREHESNHIGEPYVCHLCPESANGGSDGGARYRRGSALSHHFIAKHRLAIPTGFSRFQYKKCSDGLYRLQTNRCVAPKPLPDGSN